MNEQEKMFEFNSPLWRWDSAKSSWYFVTINQAISDEIHELFGPLAKGWGSIPVHVIIQNTQWKTSLFWSTKRGYLLPIKTQIRKELAMVENDTIQGKLLINWLF